MARTKALRQDDGKRAAIYARVSDKSQAEDDKTSLSEQTTEMEAYCEGKGMTITARYQEVGKGWSKKRPSSKGCWPTPSGDASTPSSAGSPTG